MSSSSMFDQLHSIPLPTNSFAGQTVIVTGSNIGLGFEAARHFVRLDAARVILAVRTIEKGESAKSAIEASTGRKNVIDVWQVDMSDYESVIAFAKRCQSLDRLDVVVENAGVLRNRFEECAGTEITIAVNVIGTFLLALNLLPIMRQSWKNTGQVSRLVVVSSVMHESARLKERHESSIFEAFKKQNESYMADRYNTSKLLEVFLVRSIADAAKNGPRSEEPVIINAVNPGLCHSELDREIKGILGPIFRLIKVILARTTEVGARTFVHSAAAGIESNGQYMSEGIVKQPSAFVRSREGAETQARVHQELMTILEGIQPGITNNL